jgi:hypothetical protein
VPSIEGDVRRLPATPSGLAVDELAVATVAAALRAGALLSAARTGSAPPTASLSAAHVADAVRSELFLSVPGEPRVSGFAPLSRFWQTGEGWLRTHANYPWHLAALQRATKTPEGRADIADLEAVAAALLTDSALQWEERIAAAGGVAAAVRTPEQWSASEPGKAVNEAPLVRRLRLGDGPAVAVPERLRVLDLTRVIAGPVASRTLGSFGADVLRLDYPARPELPFHQIDGVLGKRSALLDLTTAAGVERLHELLRSADVVMYGYRPGSSALEPQLLAERYPGIVVVQLSAWGEKGPWGGRRGFDSLVQAASGIAHLQYAGDDRPGTLPCQLLDHATGYLMAASALLGVCERSRNGGSHLLQLSLAGTAKKLLATPRTTLRAEAKSTATIEDWAAPVVRSDGTTISAVTPPGRYDGVPLRWPAPMGIYGQAIPAWDPSTTTF